MVLYGRNVQVSSVAYLEGRLKSNKYGNNYNYMMYNIGVPLHGGLMTGREYLVSLS